MAADRTVRVSLTAQVTGYLQGMEKARKATADAGTAAEQAKAKLEAQSAAMTKIGTGLLAIGTVAALGIGLAIKTFVEFDQAMSNVLAATHESTANMGLLREAALEAGASTVFSATESANAIEELGKAGLTAADILSGGLDGALSLAAAGGLGVAEAAGIAAVQLKTFKLEGSDMSHVADLLAAGAGKAMGDVTDLSAALSQSGQVAASTGISIEETTGTLAAFAAQGLLGSDAGTSFKSMLQRLTPQSAEAKNKMDELGISAYDAGGNFIGMAKFAGVLQTALKDKTTEERNSAMATIFGSDAVRAATVLMSEGEDGIKKWTNAVDDQGYAADTAAARLDNLAGDLEALGGSIDTALIQSGSAANGTLRFLTQAAGSATDAFGQMPVPLQGVALGIAAVTAASGLGVGGFMTLVPKVVEYREALKDLGPTAQKAGKVVGVAMKGLGAIAAVAAAIAIVDQLDRSIQGAGVSTTDLANTLKSGSIKDAVKDAFEGAGSFNDMEVDLKNFGGALDDVAESWDTRWAGVFGTSMVGWMDGTDEATDTTRDALDKLGDTLAGMPLNDARDAMRGLRGEYDLTDKQMMTLIDASGPFRDALIAEADKTGQLADDQTLLKIALEEAQPAVLSAADAYLETADQAASLDDQIITLMDSMNELNGVGQDASGANIAYQQSLADVDEQIRLIAEGVEGYAAGLDISTEAGRTNRGMLDELAASNQTAAAAQFDLDGNTANYKATLEAGHQAVYDRAVALGANADEANRIADEISKIPEASAWTMLVDTSEATRKLQAFLALYNAAPAELRVGPGVLATPVASPWRKATGGTIRGPGTSTSDSIPVMLSNGEEVTRASMADKYRPLLKAINADRVPGYANGGTVGYATAPQYVTQGGGGGRSVSTITNVTNNNTFTAPAIETQDALTYATVLGREFGRQMAG